MATLMSESGLDRGTCLICQAYIRFDQVVGAPRSTFRRQMT